MSTQNRQNGHIPTILIIGAGLGGLLLYHGIQTNLNKVEKKFNVKIFERDTGPQDRWQGSNIGFKTFGLNSLISCLPEPLIARLPNVMPIAVHGIESKCISFHDYEGTELQRSPSIHAKSLFELVTSSDPTASVVICYRNRLRDLMLEGVDMQWGMKCIGYDETDNEVWAIFQDGTRVRGDILIGSDGIHSPIRKQKLPHLQTFDYGITQVIIDATPNKKLMDRIVALSGNCLTQNYYGQDGDFTFSILRLIPIETDITENTPDDQIHYRIALCYTYFTHWDKNIDVDDNNPQSVMNHVKTLIKKHRKPCELTDILLELVSTLPVSPPKEHEKKFFRTYNPLRRRPLQDINPMSIEPWESTRVTLLGDAIHAMNPYLGNGANNALQDSYLLVKCLSNYEKDGYKQCIQEYENEMRIRASKYVLESRLHCMTLHLPRSKYTDLFENVYLSGKL